MNEQEWLRRYVARFVAVDALSPEAAEEYSRTETFAVLSDGFEDDPEGAADSHMSYWESD